MANRLYNKQVTPKGYKKGGGVDVKKAKEFRKNKKTPIRTFIKNTLEGKYSDDRRGTAEPLDLLKRKRMKKGGPSKKPKVRKIGVIGVGKAKDYPGIKEIIKMNKQGKKRFGMKMGGALKPVDPKTQKGLSKLPTEVRNKMGYMKKGGKVHGK